MGNKCASDNSSQIQKQPGLTVFVKSAQGLPAKDWARGTDRLLYVAVGTDVGSDEFFKSQIRKNVVDPVWNEECEVLAGVPLIVSIFQIVGDGNAEVVASAILDLASAGIEEFNGELPLEGTGNSTGGVLSLKVKSGDEYPAEQDSEFTISIDSAKKKTLGLHVDGLDPEKLFVTGVKKGSALDLYNEGHPENKVEFGCFITSVTTQEAGSSGCLGAGGGSSGSQTGAQAMEKILKRNPKQVDLVCRRAQQFRIALNMPEKGGIGVEVPKRALGNSLIICVVKEKGPMQSWNTDNPNQTVEPWDRIVAVGGQQGKVAALENLIKTGQTSGRLILTIARMAPEVP